MQWLADGAGECIDRDRRHHDADRLDELAIAEAAIDRVVEPGAREPAWISGDSVDDIDYAVR